MWIALRVALTGLAHDHAGEFGYEEQHSLSFRDKFRRLSQALRRHGLRQSAVLALRAVQECGPEGVYRLLEEGQPFCSVAGGRIKHAPALWPPRFAADGSVQASLWNRCSKRRVIPTAVTDDRPIL